MNPDDTDADREHDQAMDTLVAALWAEKRAQPPKENPMTENMLPHLPHLPRRTAGVWAGHLLDGRRPPAPIPARSGSNE